MHRLGFSSSPECVEGEFYELRAVGILSLLTIVTLRQEATAGAEAASLLTVGESLVALHDWTFLFGPASSSAWGTG